MTHPSPPQPAAHPAAHPADPTVPSADRASDRFADLPGVPIAEHVARFEAEHDRLVGELRAVDEL